MKTDVQHMIEAAAQAQEFINRESYSEGVCGTAVAWRDAAGNYCVEGNGTPVVEVYVDKKRPLAQLSKPVGKYFSGDVCDSSGKPITTQINVIEVGPGGFRSFELRPTDPVPQAAPAFERAYNRIMGGLQIAPDRAQWVGTLGGIFMATINGRTVYGGLTNAHVTGLNAQPGALMMQPDSSFQRGGFGRVAWVSPFSRNNDNLMDTGLIDCDASEGWWKGNRRWTVHPVQFTGSEPRPLSLRWADPIVGMRVYKCGRTTGYTRGTCIAVGSRTTVNYGRDGSFGFVRMANFRGDNNRDLSQPGDSGSYIIEEATGHVVAHLFAGGGGITIGYPIRHVIESIGGRLAENPPK